MKKMVLLGVSLSLMCFSCGKLTTEAKTEVEWERIVKLRLQSESHTLSSKWEREKRDNIPTTTGVLGE